MNTATLLLTLLFAGLSSQWLAWRFQVPAIVVLITVGLILGPVTGFIAPGMSPHDLSEMIGLGVAIILFEGGMDLKKLAKNGPEFAAMRVECGMECNGATQR